MILTLECLPGVGILPQLLRLGVEDPGLVDAAGMEVGVQEDADNQSQVSIMSLLTNQRPPLLPVKRFLQLVFLLQNSVKL